VTHPALSQQAAGWHLAKIGDLFDSWGGHTPSKANRSYWGDGLPWISSKEVKSTRLRSSTYAVTQKAIDETGLHVCPVGSVIVVVRSGILAHTLPVAITEVPLTINQDLKAFYSDEPLLNEWLALFLQMSAHELLASSRRDGTTVQSIQYPLLKDAIIPIPPIDDRRRIIEIVEAVLAKRAAIPPRLAAGQRAISRFRQAVLAAACSGRLTADWRDAHPNVQSVASALAAMPSRAHRRTSDDDLSDLSLPQIPETYVLSTVRQAATAIEYGTSKPATSMANTGIPVLRMGNIQDGRVALADLKFIQQDSEIRRLMLQDGDLLFNRTNSPELVGKSAVFHEQMSMTFASYLIRIQFAPEVADPDFVNFWVNSAWGKAWAHQVKTDGVSQSNINGTKLGAMPLPLPPIEEQREIVRRASRMLELADGLLARIRMASRQVDRSSQAILGKAFRGDLDITRQPASDRPVAL
jgi:type I restriction enzyme S subunit